MYGLATDTKIDSDLVKIVRVYFEDNKTTYRDDKRETIRRLIAEKTHYDVAIGEGLIRRGLATTAYSSLTASFCAILLFWRSKVDNFEIRTILVTMSIAVPLVFWVFYSLS